ncbi:MAG: RidA family protein [Orrella sp.]|uniref:RidA family protein n=1 Tax=Orrella sp. TaxID=1921583 RepID=UPI003BE91570
MIQSDLVPNPKGHYSQAIVSNGLIFVSGLLPDVAASDLQDSFERQVRSVFERAQQILEVGNSSMDQVVQCTAYISDVALWPQFNEIYASIFGAHKPARAVVPVAALHYGFQVEVQIVAEVNAK